MQLIRVLGMSIAMLTVGCTTTTYRSVQEMESHNGNLVLKYGELVTRQDLFSTQLISNEQHIATCEQTESMLNCKTLNLTIDNKPLVFKK